MVAPSLEDVRQALGRREPTTIAEVVSFKAAVAVILNEVDAGLEVLFIRRAEHPQDPWSGQMAFPGGRSEPDDADLRATAVRETVEEIGIDLDRSASPLGRLDELRATARARPVDLSITPFVYHLPQRVEAAPSSEVRSVHWIPLVALLDVRYRSTYEYRHLDMQLDLPCIRVDGHVIWGLTYRMFANFEALLLA